MRKTFGDDGQASALPLKGPDGASVTAQVEFVPEGSGGTATVEFRFDASTLDGPVEAVAFERLFEGNQEVAVHEDAADAGQTVLLSPPEPQEPASPENPSAVPLPKTGDGVLPLAMAALVVAAVAGLAAVGARFGGKASEHFRKRL